MNTPNTTSSPASRIVTVLLVAGLLVAAFVYRDLLTAWFTGRDMSASAPMGGHDVAPSAAEPKPETTPTHGVEYSATTVDALRTAIEAYERIRATLSRDDTSGVAEAARAVAEALRGASSTVSDEQKPTFAETASLADKLTTTGNVDAARHAFAELNARLLPLLSADARLVSDKHVFECSMFEHARWMQTATAVENPYMGSKMLGCGVASAWGDDHEQRHAGASASADEIDHYTCSMHPSVNQPGPGKCPICGMDLIPVTKEQQREGVVMIDEVRRQLIGVRTAPVVEGPMRRSFRAVGKVTYDESSFTDVNLKVSGWITKLLVTQTGQRVTRGQTLFMLYSPDLYAAQQDFLLALRGARVNPATGADNYGGRMDQLVRAARKRLSLLGLSDAQIDTIAAGAEPIDTIPITSPASGFVIEKDVVEGASVQASMRLLRIAALEKVWVEADVYEEDLAHVRVGQPAKVTLDYLPGQAYDAKVSYVYPYLESDARTGRVRIELANKKLDLRPGMYARVELSAEIGARLQVPASAVVYTGPRRLVFVDLGDGRFKPEEVHIGVEANGMYEVLDGLKPGDMVATSGMFLIAAEARISTAAKYWDNEVPPAAPAAMPVKAQQPAADPTVAEPATAANPARKRGAAPTNAAQRDVTAPAVTSTPAATTDTAAPGTPSVVYSCPMHPEVRSTAPGKCPKCGMNLVPMPKGTAP